MEDLNCRIFRLYQEDNEEVINFFLRREIN